MDIKHILPDETEEFPTEERCHILELFNDSAERSHSLARARVEPGITTAWHLLKGCTEFYYILHGEGLVEVGENFQVNVGTGEVVRIPPDTPQRITNTGLEDLLFLCFCSPAFDAAIYEALE